MKILPKCSLIIASCALCTLTSCSLVTVPLTVLGKAATTTIDVAGKAAGAGLGVISRGGLL